MLFDLCKTVDARLSSAITSSASTGSFEHASRGRRHHARGAAQAIGGAVDSAQGTYSRTEPRLSRPQHSWLYRVAAGRFTGIRLHPFAYKQALLSGCRLRRSRYGPYIDLLHPGWQPTAPMPSCPSTALTASGATSEAASGRPWPT